MRRWMLIGVSFMVLAGAGVAMYELRYRTDHHTTPIDVDVAVQDFNAATGTASIPHSTPSGVLPAPGVYSYTTTGGDGVDALGGASHAYPSTTTITVTASGCGVEQRWAPAAERFDDFVTCDADGGVDLSDFTAFHRFFGRDENERYLCAGDPRPLGAPAGTTWTTSCTKQTGTNDVGAVSTWTGTVVGAGVVAVDGHDVDVEHVTVSIDDNHEGNAQVTDTWYQSGTDLVVRRVVNNTTTSRSPVGAVHYLEHFDMTIDSLTPAR